MPGVELRFRRVLQWMVVLGVASAAVAAQAQDGGGRAFNVEDLLSLESIRSAQFDPLGRYVVYEYLPPRSHPAGLGRINSHGEEQSKLYVFDLQGTGAPRLLFKQDVADGYSLRSVSPNGAFVIYARFSAGKLTYGALDVSTGVRLEFPGTPDCHFTHAPQKPVWVSDHEVVYALSADGHQPVGCSGRALAPSELQRAWQASYEGLNTTVSVLGSGPHKSVHDQPQHQGQLVRVDVSNGQTMMIAEGNFVSWFASPDRAAVAAVRIRPAALDAAIPIDEHTFARGSHKQLMLYELESRRARSVCDACADVEPSSVAWSATGRRIGFVARSAAASWRDTRLWAFDVGSGVATQSNLHGVQLFMHPNRYPLGPSWAWDGDVMVVSGTLAGSSQVAWYRLGQRGLEAASPPPAAPPPAAGLGASKMKALISAPPGKVVAALDDRAALIYTELPSGMGELVIATAERPPSTIAKLNRHLAEIDRGKLIRLVHQAPGGEKLISWLLLPPFMDAQRRVSMVCDVYPSRDNQSNFVAGPAMAERSDLNGYVLAGHGYAVLYPGMPLNGPDGQRLPAEGLSAMLLSAVDAAVATGNIDGDNVAVQGQSNGGFATVAILTQTNRFKAAVAQAGIYNLFSAYGMFNVAETLNVQAEGPAMNGAAWLELGQAGIGAPPWVVPERYLDNSPLMGVAHINTPVLILHGDRDPVVNITQSEELFTALYRLNKSAVFARYWGEGHLLFNPANIRDKWRRVLAWYDAQLLPAR